MYWIVTIVVCLVLAYLPAKVAERKGRDFFAWYIYGAFLWLIAMLHAISLPEPEQKEYAAPYKEPDEPVSKTKILNFKEQIIAGKVDINAIINVKSYEILKKADDQMYVKMTFTNTTKREIKALKVKARGYDSFRDLIEIDGCDTFQILIQDLSLTPNKTESSEVMLDGQKGSIRELELFVDQICYSDGEIETCKESDYVETCLSPLADEYHNYARKYNNKAGYHMIDNGDYWQCICGNVNLTERCSYCRMSKQNAEEFSESNIVAGYRKYLQQEEEKQEQEKEKRIQEEKRRKREAEKEQAEQIKLKQSQKRKLRLFCGILFISLITLLPIYRYHYYKKQDIAWKIGAANYEIVNSYVNTKSLEFVNNIDDTWEDAYLNQIRRDKSEVYSYLDLTRARQQYLESSLLYAKLEGSFPDRYRTVIHNLAWLQEIYVIRDIEHLQETKILGIYLLDNEDKMKEIEKEINHLEEFLKTNRLSSANVDDLSELEQYEYPSVDTVSFNRKNDITKQGILFDKDGYINYIGRLEKGIPNGEGRLYYPYSAGGKLYFEGEFVKGEPTEGTRYDSNGNSLED